MCHHSPIIMISEDTVTSYKHPSGHLCALNVWSFSISCINMKHMFLYIAPLVTPRTDDNPMMFHPYASAIYNRDYHDVH